MKFLLIALLSFSAFAEDQIVTKLKEENILLQKQINKNKEFIQARETLKTNFKVKSDNQTVSTLKRKRSRNTEKEISNLYFGIESYNWGDGIDQGAPTLAYEMGKDNWSVAFSYGQLNLSNFPAVGTASLVHILKGAIQYNISFMGDRLNFAPSLGYRIYNVDSPDAGNIDDAYMAQRELDLVQRIEDETGIVPGVMLSYHMSNKWDLAFKADLGATGRVAGLHLGYKL